MGHCHSEKYRMRTIILASFHRLISSPKLDGKSPLVEGTVKAPRLKVKFASLLLAAIFIFLTAHCAFALNTERGNAPATSAHTGAQAKADAATTEDTEHGPTQQAVEIARPFGFPITNSMVVSWIVAVGLIVFAQVATRRMKPVPDGIQNFWEWLVEGLYGFLEGIIGSHLVKRTFWFFATIFIFILSANWMGLIPGVGTIGWGHHNAH